MPDAIRLNKKHLSGEPTSQEKEAPATHSPLAASPTLEEIKKQYGISDKDYQELVELLDVTTQEEPSPARMNDFPSKYLLATAAEHLNFDLSDEDRKRWEGLKSPRDVVRELVKLVSERTVLRSNKFAHAGLHQYEYLPRSLDHLSEKDIQGLTVMDFTRVPRHTKDPRKLVLGLNVFDRMEVAFQEGLKKYLKENHGVEPKGKVHLNIIIQKYESVKNGTTYKGYVQAGYDGRSTILYSLTAEELAAELERRQISQSAAASASLAR